MSSTKDRGAREPFPIPARTFLHPAVLLEVVFGMIPLAGIAFWHWDIFLVVMVHLLAMAIQGAFLALRAATLPAVALGYFQPLIGKKAGKKTDTFTDGRPPPKISPWRVRALLAACVVGAIGFPLLLFVAIVVEQFGGKAYGHIRSVGDFWRIIVVATGAWVPLGIVVFSAAGGYVFDMLAPLLTRRLPALADYLPKRRIGAEWQHLAPELRDFLIVRAHVVLQMIVTVFGVVAGFVFSQGFGVVVVALLLVAVKTAVAVFLQAGAVVDARREAERDLRHL